MKVFVISLILFSVTCSAVAQLLLKIGMSQPSVKAAIAEAHVYTIMSSIATNAWVIGGLALYFFGALVWLFVLAKVEVSYAYPFVGLGFILVLIAGRLALADTLSGWKVLGTLLVSVGVVLIAAH